MSLHLNSVSRTTSWLIVLACLVSLNGCSTVHDWFSSGNTSDQKTTAQINSEELAAFIQSVKPVYGNADNHYRLGRYFQTLGRHSIAQDEFVKTLAMDPGYSKAYNALGVSYDCLGQHGLALASYHAALELEPDAAYILNNIGYSHMLNGNPDAAVKGFEKAVALNPGNRKYQNNLNLVLSGKMHPGALEINDGTAESLSQHQGPSTDSAAALAQAGLIPDNPDLYSIPSEQAEAPMNTFSPAPEAQQTAMASGGIAADCISMKIEPVPASSAVAQVGEPAPSDEKAGGMFAIQIGAFTSIERAKSMVSVAEEKGFQCLYITQVRSDNPYYRVRLGKFNSLSEADSYSAAISDNYGIDAFTVYEKSTSKILYASTNECTPDRRVAEKEKLNFSVEICNGNGIRHMASYMADCLRKQGFDVKKLSNAAHFNFPKTRILYSEGYYESACQLALEFPGIDSLKDIKASTGLKQDVKILLGKDLVPFNTSIRNGFLNVRLDDSAADIKAKEVKHRDI